MTNGTLEQLPWFKAKLNQYYILFEDKKEDYIKFTDINDLDMRSI